MISQPHKRMWNFSRTVCRVMSLSPPNAIFVMLAPLILAGLTYLNIRYILPMQIRYKITDTGVRIFFFFLFSFCIRFEKILDIKIISSSEIPRFSPSALRTLLAGNRFVGQVVLISYRGGVFNKVALTPTNPLEFVKATKECIANST